MTNGELKRENKRNGICLEPMSDCLVNYEQIRRSPIDMRAAGFSSRDNNALNRTQCYSHMYDEMTVQEAIVQGYVSRCLENGEDPDPKVVRALKE